MVGTCSATGLYTARGIGAELIRRDPGSYLSTVGILAGPLLLLQTLSLLLTIGIAVLLLLGYVLRVALKHAVRASLPMLHQEVSDARHNGTAPERPST